jgi:hypothetical protein
MRRTNGLRAHAQGEVARGHSGADKDRYRSMPAKLMDHETGSLLELAASRAACLIHS